MLVLLGFAAGCAFGLFFGWLLHRERVERALYEDVVRTRDRATATLAETSARLELANRDMVRLRGQLTNAQHLLAERDATIDELEDELEALEGHDGYQELAAPSADGPVDVIADAATTPDDVRLDHDDVGDEVDITEEVALPVGDGEAPAEGGGDGDVRAEGGGDGDVRAEGGGDGDVRAEGGGDGDAGVDEPAPADGAHVEVVHVDARPVDAAEPSDEIHRAADGVGTADRADVPIAEGRMAATDDVEAPTGPAPRPPVAARAADGVDAEGGSGTDAAGAEGLAEASPMDAAEPEGVAEASPTDAAEPEGVAEDGSRTDVAGLVQDVTPDDAGGVTGPAQEAPPGAAAHDDLQLIRGVGPALERQLHAEGITSFRQLALLDEAAISDLEPRRPQLVRRLRRGGWIAQARRLHLETHGDPP